MNSKQLKDSILQYAMQGNLVPQDPNDEPADKILQRIYEERKYLTQEKIIKSNKEIEQISEDEIPYDIPESWKWVRLNDLAENCNFPFADGPFGSNLKREHYIAEPEVRIIQLSNIGENGWKDQNVKFTSFQHLESIKRSEVRPGDLVIAKMMPAGRAIVVPNEHSKYVLSSDAVKFVPNEILNKEYLLYAINSNVFREQIYSEVQGITRVRTSLTKIKKYLLPIPPLNEQDRIVRKIKELFQKVESFSTYQKDIEELQKNFPSKLENSILHYAMQGKIVEQDPNDEPAAELVKEIREEKERLIEEKVIKQEKALPPIDDSEIPFDIPESWEWVRLGDISSKIHYGYTASAQEKGNAKLLRITDIQNNQVIWENVPYCDVDKRKLDSIVLKERDILIARTGGTIGKSFLMSNVKEISVFASYLIRVQPLTRVNEIYLTYFLQSEIYWRQLKEMSAGTGQPNVNAQNLKKLLLPLPPLKEQARIIEGIRNYFDVTKKLV